MFCIDKNAVRGYDLYRNDNTGKAFVGHYRDKRDCERVIKRTIQNEKDEAAIRAVAMPNPFLNTSQHADIGQG